MRQVGGAIAQQASQLLAGPGTSEGHHNRRGPARLTWLAPD